MDIIKTIFRLSFFLLGCVMLILSLLVIPIGFSSFIWFFSFAVLFYLLSYKITFGLIKSTFEKVFKVKFKTASAKSKWIPLNNENVTYNEVYHEITVNEKVYRYSQLVSVDLFYNNKIIELKELKKRKTFKTLEIKIGIKVNKVSYKKLKYITLKSTKKEKKDGLKNAIADFEKLLKIMNTKTKKEKIKKPKKEKVIKQKNDKQSKEKKIKLPKINFARIKKEKTPKIKKEKKNKVKKEKIKNKKKPFKGILKKN